MLGPFQIPRGWFWAAFSVVSGVCLFLLFGYRKDSSLAHLVFFSSWGVAVGMLLFCVCSKTGGRRLRQIPLSPAESRAYHQPSVRNR
jgi:hypothetical protein